jgi:hypothetical protein
MSDDLVKRLERLKWMVHCEMRGLIPDTTAYEAAAEIRSLREQVARARLEGAEIMREAAFCAVSFDVLPGEEAWYARDMAQDRVANLDPAAILEAHTREP